MQLGAGIFRLLDDAVHYGILTLTQAVCALLIVSARRGWRHKTIDWLYFWTAAFKWIWALDLAEVPLNVTIYPAKVMDVCACLLISRDQTTSTTFDIFINP